MDELTLLQLVVPCLLMGTCVALPLSLLALAVNSLCHRGLPPWARQAIWSLVLIRLMLPLSVGSSASLQPAGMWLAERAFSLVNDLAAPPIENPVEDPSVLPSEHLDYVTQFDNPVVLAAGSQSYVTQPEVVDPMEYALSVPIPLVLLAGMGVMAFWTVITTLRLRHAIHVGTACTRADWQALLTDGRELFGIRRTVSLRLLPGLNSPATTGIWRPQILLPEDAATWSPDELKHVVWHELAHIRRHDVAMNWLLAVVRVVHWWNPLFWGVQRAWLAEREMACDALVLQHLGPAQSGNYGRTLLTFAARLGNAAPRWPAATAPGLVLLLGRKHALRRRLIELSRPNHRPTRWRRGLACSVIACLAATGLTDASQAVPHAGTTTSTAVPENRWQVEVPAGTTWGASYASPVHIEAPRMKVTYDLAPVIARIQQDEPKLEADAAASFLKQMFEFFLKPDAKIARPLSFSELDGHKLAITATVAQHISIKAQLDRWALYGQRQVTLEVCFLRTGQTLQELITTRGGEVLLSEQRSAGGPPILAEWSEQIPPVVRPGLPTYTRLLAPHEASAVQQAISAAGGVALYGPKVTTFDGVSFLFSDSVRPPAVEQKASSSTHARIIQNSNVAEGISMMAMPYVSADGKSLRLSFGWRQATVTALDVVEVRSEERSLDVHMPQVSYSNIRGEVELADGHTLLIAPLQRDAKGQLTICLIRPQVLTKADMQ